MKINCATFDILFIANYLCFRVFAERMGRNFDEYIEKSVEEYDHPHPGVRMHYTSIYIMLIGLEAIMDLEKM